MTQAAGKKISQFIGKTTLVDSDYITLVASGVNYKMTVFDLKNALAQTSTSVKKYTETAVAYTLTNADYLLNCTSGTFAVLLPSPSGIVGQQFVVKNSGTGSITVTPSSGETIDGAATKILVQYDAIMITSDGANWIIV